MKMGNIKGRGLLVAEDILKMDKVVKYEDTVSIPLTRIPNNQSEYDEFYSLMGEDSGFLNDITYANLTFNVKLNSINQFYFSVSANFKEFSLEDIPEYLLEKYNNQIQVCLSDEELEDIYHILFDLFYKDELIADMRLQVANSIPSEHLKGKKLFAEEVTNKGYRCVWTTPTVDKCVLGQVENINDNNGVVKAYIF